jgi:CRP-like cAMP-binding protein
MRRTLGPIVLAGSAIMGLSLISVALLGQLTTAFLALTACGIGASMVIVSARTLLQRSTDNLVLARVLAVQEGVKTTGQALGSLVGPLLIFLLGASVAFIPVGLIILLSGLLSFRAVRRLESTATVRVREAQLLAGVPFLSPLAPYELEHLAQSALWRRHAAGTDVVRQGDEGDAFYVVAQGELSVTVDGRLREHTLGPGEGFGEIALLHQVRRTATVTTLTDCELLMVDMAQFLAAMTASADGTDLAREVSQARLAADRDAA